MLFTFIVDDGSSAKIIAVEARDESEAADMVEPYAPVGATVEVADLVEVMSEHDGIVVLTGLQ